MEKDKLQKDEGTCTENSKNELKDEELEKVSGGRSKIGVPDDSI